MINWNYFTLPSIQAFLLHLIANKELLMRCSFLLIRAQILTFCLRQVIWITCLNDVRNSGQKNAHSFLTFCVLARISPCARLYCSSSRSLISFTVLAETKSWAHSFLTFYVLARFSSSRSWAASEQTRADQHGCNQSRAGVASQWIVESK